ncbi:MAG TPA: HipA family kinase, partial [Nitrospira sp.]|nr:HipA family kinase [Nitrospira sp.]
MNPDISAIQHLRPLRGGAQSHLMRASDGHFYVTKFQNNPQHVRVLANEMFATELGLRLGLPLPPVRVLEVSE